MFLKILKLISRVKIYNPSKIGSAVKEKRKMNQLKMHLIMLKIRFMTQHNFKRNLKQQVLVQIVTRFYFQARQVLMRTKIEEV